LTVTAVTAQGQDSPLARASGRSGYPRDVVVAERFQFFPGGRALPVTGDEAKVIARLESRQAVAGDLGLSLMPGLTVGTGHTVRIRGARPAGRPARLVTLRPVAFRGVPLAPGSDVLSVASADGKLLVARERNLPRAVDGTAPTVSEDDARTAALAAGREHAMPADAAPGTPRLEVFVDRSAQGRLAWRIRVASPSLSDPWARELWIAALGPPDVLADREGIYHTHDGQVTANAWTDTPFGNASAQDLAAAIVRRNGNPADTAVTAPDGRYAFTSGGGTATLAVGVTGTHSVVDNRAGAEVAVTGSGSPGIPVDLFINAGGDLELAQTTAFVWVSHAHAFSGDFLPGTALAGLATNVNIARSCNAFWDGRSVNFFQAGGDCPNTAYSDVVLHEYGHAVDASQGGILDGGYSEGFGDALAILRTRQSCAGRDFLGAGTCLRQAGDVVLWPPDSGEVHQIGRRYAGFVQALIDELRAVLGPDEAFETARQLVLGAGAANPGSIPDAVRLSFVVDDDDGILENGTPHCAQLAAAARSRRIPHPSCPSFEHVRVLADIDGDRRADIVGFGDKGVSTALANTDGSFAGEQPGRANFGAAQGWNPARHVRTMADIDGDGKADIVAFGDAGVWTALARGGGAFSPEHFVRANFGSDQAWDAARHVRTTADINGDGKADIVAFGDAGVWTALSSGDGAFAPEHLVLGNFGSDQAWDAARHVRTLADINGDGKADIVAFGDAGVWTALSSGDGAFAPEHLVLGNFGSDQAWSPTRHVRTTADISGDGKADIVAFGDGGVWTALSAGDGSFAPEGFVLANFGSDQAWDAGRHVRTLADISGDGRADIVAFGDGGVWTALSSGGGAFAPEGFVLADFGANSGWHPSRHVRLLADVSGDGTRDIVAFGDAGVWTALSGGGGGFAAHRFVLARFGTDQGWRGGAR
jgi:hypothetical protein